MLKKLVKLLGTDRGISGLVSLGFLVVTIVIALSAGTVTKGLVVLTVITSIIIFLILLALLKFGSCLLMGALRDEVEKQ